ncbi:MAG: ATP-binding protein [Eubacteriales bacterium]
MGSGKTHLAIAIGIAACNNGKKVKFYRTVSLVNELVEVKKQGSIVKLLKSIHKCDLLICDEWGYVPVDTNGAKLLFDVIADCYERKSLIITTNLEFTK